MLADCEESKAPVEGATVREPAPRITYEIAATTPRSGRTAYGRSARRTLSSPKTIEIDSNSSDDESDVDDEVMLASLRKNDDDESYSDGDGDEHTSTNSSSPSSTASARVQGDTGKPPARKKEKISPQHKSSASSLLSSSSSSSMANKREGTLASPKGVPSPKAPSSTTTPVARKKASATTIPGESVDVVVPQSLLSGGGGGECTVMVQVEPGDAPRLDFEGASGAIGRFEADEGGVTLDLKGFQYRGTIHSGPTAMVVSMVKGGKLKVEAITNEFVTLSKAHDIMAKLNATVEGEMDAGYDILDDNVNERDRSGKSGTNGAEGGVGGADGGKKGTKKQKKGTNKPSEPALKKRKLGQNQSSSPKQKR